MKLISHKMKILDTNLINELLKNKRKIGEGATSEVYKVNNCFTHEGFLCLKILKDIIIIKKSISEEEEAKEEEEEAKEEEEEAKEEEEEEEEEGKEIDFEKVKKLCIEYDILKRLNHPNIVKAYGFFFGDKNTNPAILLEYCKFNLEKAIKKLKDFELVGVIYEICSAMKHVHENNIIHRDLKMSNILVNNENHVKICDFGIAKQMDLTTYVSLTHGIGALAFMAPELFDEDSTYNEKVDVHSFGVVMYFIVTKGKMPKFNLKKGYEKLELPNTINELSKSIIKRSWSVNPEARPSFKEILELIVKNNFMLIDGIEEKIPQLKKHLQLK